MWLLALACTDPPTPPQVEAPGAVDPAPPPGWGCWEQLIPTGSGYCVLGSEGAYCDSFSYEEGEGVQLGWLADRPVLRGAAKENALCLVFEDTPTTIDCIWEEAPYGMDYSPGGDRFEIGAEVLDLEVHYDRVSWQTAQGWYTEGAEQPPAGTTDVVYGDFISCQTGDWGTRCWEFLMDPVLWEVPLREMRVSQWTVCGFDPDDALRCWDVTSWDVEVPFSTELWLPTAQVDALYAARPGGACARFAGEDLCVQEGEVLSWSLSEPAISIQPHSCLLAEDRSAVRCIWNGSGEWSEYPVPECRGDEG